MFQPKSTSDPSGATQKSLLYAHHGWGKTTQFIRFQERYGRGFLLSGEGGLRSIAHEPIDYLPFSSWDGIHDAAKGIYSFKGIAKMMADPSFAAQGYKWIGLDSLTELGDLCHDYVAAQHVGNKNGFELWGDYKTCMLKALKWFREMPYHVLVTALAKEETDDNGSVHYWPMVTGSSVAKQIPGVFDNVLCGVRVSSGDREKPTIKRFVITDESYGWHGKLRKPETVVIEPSIETGDVTTILDRLVV